MRRPTWQASVRGAAVLTLGALALHQLSYLLAHGDGAGRVLAAHGHGYLSTLGPILVTASLALLAATLARAALTPRSSPPRRQGCPELRAAALALAVLAIFFVQELVEALLSPDHPQGLAAFLEAGWVALPLAFPIGALAALALGVLERAALMIAAATPARRLRSAPRDLRPTGSRRERGAPLARLGLRFGLARRGPPAQAFR
jgi:hypothetical protein